MRKLTCALLLIILQMVSFKSVAQTQSVTGTLKDPENYASLKNSVVALLSTGDSILRYFTRAAENGTFKLDNVKEGKYILMATHPMFGDYVEDVTVSSEAHSFSSVKMTPKTKLLEAVLVRSGGAIRIKGDTTVYTADSFKVSANANVEELLKKLPGIQVDKNGEIKAMGEKVEKVLVDGEEFFGDDPGMAVKNLRADAVKEVQVFDKKSDQAEFTGIDDGQTKKTINLKLKEDKKKGYFGKIDAAGGYIKNIDPRYNTNLLYGSFKGKRKLSGFILSGNTGQDGLSWQDNEKYGGDDDRMSMNFDDESGSVFYMWNGGQSADEEPYINTQNGFIQNLNTGISYSNKWNDRHNFSFSPKYNLQNYDNNSNEIVRQTFTSDSVFNTNSNTTTNINRYNFKNNLVYDGKLDSVNSLKITAKANFYHTESEVHRIGSTSNSKALVNSEDRLTNGIYNKQGISTTLTFRHKFKKARRTLSFNADVNSLSTDGESILISTNEIYNFGATINRNQKSTSDKATQRYAGKLVYTEPLGKKYAIELAYESSLSNGTNKQNAIQFDSTQGKYSIAIDSLTNDFRQKINVQKPSIKLSYNFKKLKFNLGGGVGFTNFNLEDITQNKNYKRNYTNFFPQAGVTYTYKSNHMFRFFYNGSTTQPTVNQLQPLRNNDNLTSVYIGNPNLAPSFTNNFNISHNGYNFLKERWLFQSVNLNLVSNSITNSRSIDYSTGKITSMPINTNGNVNVNIWTGFGFKEKKSKINFNIGPNLNYSRFADFLNGTKTMLKTLSTGFNIWASKSKDKKYDFNFSSQYSYSNNKSSAVAATRKFSNLESNIGLTLYYKKTWSLATDYEFNWRQKMEKTDRDLSYNLLNTRLQKTFKNNEFTAYIRLRDILNQNIGLDRSFYGNTYSETRNDRLRRYFMLGFTWDFKNKAPKKTETTPAN